MYINFTKKQKIIAASSLGGCILIAGIVTAAVFLHKTKPPVPTSQNAKQVAKFIASNQFAKMDSNAKKQYMDEMSQDPELRQAMWSHRDNLSEQERSAMRQNMRAVREQQMQERMDKYFSLKTKEEKNKMLDDILSEMQKHRQERPQGERPRREAPTTQPQNGGQGGPGGNGASRESRRKTHIESTSPQVRAQRRQFRADLMARAQELGIPMPRHGRR